MRQTLTKEEWATKSYGLQCSGSSGRGGMDSSDSSLQIRSYEDGAPWVFKGRALYQLQVVKADVARKFIPSELKLVEAFGYTLGGFFLARYDGSPAGQFDEAVVIPGIVWNPPTSCAWAGRVLVGSEEARSHGRKEVGLPSHLADFSTTIQELSTSSPWWNAGSWFRGKQKTLKIAQHCVQIVQKDGIKRTPLCSVAGIPDTLMQSSTTHVDKRWMGPTLQLHLPNFSGKTKEQPKLLKYSCALNCKVRVVAPAKISSLTEEHIPGERGGEETRDLLAVLTGKPLVSIFFDRMVMSVDKPIVLELKVDPAEKNKQNDRALVPAAPSTAAPGQLSS